MPRAATMTTPTPRPTTRRRPRRGNGGRWSCHDGGRRRRRRLRRRCVLEQLPGRALGEVGRAGTEGGDRGRRRHVRVERRQVVGRDPGQQPREPDLAGRQRARRPRPGRNGHQAVGAGAIANGVPVIAYDRLIEDPDALYITFDNVEVGRMEAQAVFALVPGASTSSSRATRPTPTPTSSAKAPRRSSVKR